LARYELQLAAREPLETVPNPENLVYLRTKKRRMGHLLGSLDDVRVPLAERPSPDGPSRSVPASVPLQPDRASRLSVF